MPSFVEIGPVVPEIRMKCEKFTDIRADGRIMENRQSENFT